MTERRINSGYLKLIIERGKVNDWIGVNTSVVLKIAEDLRDARARIVELEAALKEIADNNCSEDLPCYEMARAALVPEQVKP